MARIDVTTQEITMDGLKPAMTAPNADGDVVDTGGVFLLVVSDTTPVDVTVQSPIVVGGLDVEELVVNVPVDPVPTLIGPLPKRLFGRPSTDPSADVGRAYVNYSVQAGVTRAAVSF